uniref:Cytoplasmic dynein intermediate chain n=3 Tax=Timema TaxID=61471 RepID=A0A7R8Z6K6_TIMDO|nr:unnamed protein product [Timema douglasi]
MRENVHTRMYVCEWRVDLFTAVLTFDDSQAEDEESSLPHMNGGMFQSKLPPGILPHGLPQVKEVQPAVTSLEQEQASKPPVKQVRELSEEEKQMIILTEDFQRFFDRAARVMERALSESIDIYTDYTGINDGEEGGRGLPRMEHQVQEDNTRIHFPLPVPGHGCHFCKNMTVLVHPHSTSHATLDVTCHTRRHMPHSTSHATLDVTSHTRRHIPHSTSHPTLDVTCHTRRHIPHSTSHATLDVTCHTRRHMPHSTSHVTLNVTCHTQRHMPHSTSHATLNVTCHTKHHMPHSTSHATLDVTSHTRRHMPHSTSHVTLDITCHTRCHMPHSTFNPNLILGGTYSGQIVLWDNRVQKRTPIQRTPLSATAHTHPVYCMNVVGTQNAHNLISISTDGRLCSWSLDMLSQPQDTLELQHKQGKAIAVTCLAFPHNDVNNFVVGSEEGSVYTACRHGSKAGVTETYDGHQGPVTGISTHAVQGGIDFSHLFLTSSFDWTVKLWSLKENKPLYSFEDNGDYVYDVAWSPIHPALFATVDGTGRLDLWNLNQETEVPVASVIVEGASALNRVSWTPSGLHVTVGDDMGKIWVYDVGEQLAQPRHDEWNKFVYTLQELKNNQADEEIDKLNLGSGPGSLSSLSSLSSTPLR